MAGDSTSSYEAIGQAFVEVPDTARSKRAGDRWPLLAAVQRVAAVRKTVASVHAASARPAPRGDAWWEE